jgi:two-component system, OmpR family, response regulator
MSSPAAPQPGRKKRILIAEDDREIAALLERLLIADYEVVVTRDGASAISAANAQTTLDLLLLDVMMPGIDGVTVAQTVRGLAAHKKVPIIFITAKDSPMDVVRGIQAGARSYITKPFKLPDVLAKVKKAVGG